MHCSQNNRKEYKEKRGAVAKSETLPALLYNVIRNKPKLSDNVEAFLDNIVRQSAEKDDFATAPFWSNRRLIPRYPSSEAVYLHKIY